MQSLKSLSDINDIEEFAKIVAESAQKMRCNEIANVNDGIKTTEELNARLHSGRFVQFDYQRLIDDAECYI